MFMVIYTKFWSESFFELYHLKLGLTVFSVHLPVMTDSGWILNTIIFGFLRYRCTGISVFTEHW